MKFIEMTKEQREKHLNIAYDKFNNFIKDMAVKTNTLDKFNSVSVEEFQNYAEEIANQLGMKEELDEMVEYIEVAYDIHKGLCNDRIYHERRLITWYL